MSVKLRKYVLTLLWVCIFQTVIPFSSMAVSPRCASLFAVKNVRSLAKIKDLTLMTFNVANIYELKGKFERVSEEEMRPMAGFPARSKDEKNVEELKRIVNEVSPDIAILEEVEGLSALQRFASELPVSYRSFLVPGNDIRGIDIGFLVRSDLQLSVEMHSHRDYQFPNPRGKKNITVFTRDFPVLVLREKAQGKPLLMIFGVHLKSKRDKANDPGSQLLRGAQVNASVEIMREYQRRYGEDIPIVMAGDFNTDVLMAPEMRALDWIPSAFELATKTTPRAARITHTLHRESTEYDGNVPLGEIIDMQQLDDIRLFGFPKNSVEVAEVYRYRDEQGHIKPFALSYSQRLEQTSDHLPVVVKISADFLRRQNNK